MATIRIVAYCHYIPSRRQRDHQISEECDSSLNNAGLGLAIQLACVQGAATADFVFVQSQYAKNLLLALAARYGVTFGPTPIVAPPPRDPLFSATSSSVPVKNRTIVYNHRLYEHYGTWDFLSLFNSLRDVIDCNLVLCDPMPNRSSVRDLLDPSVSTIKEYVREENLGIIIPGGNRESYRKTVESARIGFSSFQQNCVWSMSVADLLGMGIPVVAPRDSAFPEMIPESCLFSSREEGIAIAAKLLSDDAFWARTSRESLAISRSWTAAAFCQKLTATIGEPVNKENSVTIG